MAITPPHMALNVQLSVSLSLRYSNVFPTTNVLKHDSFTQTAHTFASRIASCIKARMQARAARVELRV